MNIRIVRYKNIPIVYNYQIKKVKNINLRISKDKTINVSIPRNVDIKYIDNFVLKNAEFILKFLSKKEEVKFNENQGLENTDHIVFLGNKYKVQASFNDKNILELDTKKRLANFLMVKQEAKVRQKIYDDWQMLCAEEIFRTLFEECFLLFEKYGIEKPGLKFKKLKSRWGSMNISKKEMTLNIFLLDTPYDCIRYVVIHEFAHLIQANHSKQFYNVVEDIMPEYKKYEKLLKQFTTRKRFIST